MKKRMGKTAFVMGLVLIAATSVGLAALVNYLSNTVTTEIHVDSPIELDNEQFELHIEYGGEYNYTLVNGTNRANVPIEARAKLIVEKWNSTTGAWEPVDEGYYIAATDDIQYYFEESHDGQTWREWMEENWDLLDWYVLDSGNLTTCTMTEAIQAKYRPMYDDVGVNTTVYAPGPCLYNEEMLDPDLENKSNNPDLVPVLTKENNTIVSPYVTIEPGNFSLVIKFGTLSNIEPGYYRISLIVIP